MRGTRTKWAMAAIALVIGIGVYVAALPTTQAIVFAGPGVCTYYSSAKYRTVVGARGTGCCGSVINWGVTSPYYRCETIYCLDVICPN